MNTEEALVRAISDAPEDELNWLAYADWLEEQGELLGEMIRLRIRLDKLSANDPTRPALEQRHAILESATGFAGWADRLAGCGFAVRRRGFFVELYLDLCRWALPFGEGRHVLALTRLRPIFEWLRTSPCVPRRFAALPAKLDVLGDKNYGSEKEIWLTADVAGEMLALPCFQNLQSLTIDGNGTVILDAETVRVVVTHPNLERLRVLELSGHRLGAEGAQAMASSGHLTNLTRLQLRRSGIDDAAAGALSGSAHLANLTELDVRGNQITDAGALALAASPYLTRLKTLKLAHNAIGPDAAATLKRRFGAGCLIPRLPGSAQSRPGDWYCFECSTSNFASRDACYECRSARPGPPSRPAMREGDWLCPVCTAHNFARRQTCHQCQAARPG